MKSSPALRAAAIAEATVSFEWPSSSGGETWTCRSPTSHRSAGAPGAESSAPAAAAQQRNAAIAARGLVLPELLLHELLVVVEGEDRDLQFARQRVRVVVDAAADAVAVVHRHRASQRLQHRLGGRRRRRVLVHGEVLVVRDAVPLHEHALERAARGAAGRGGEDDAECKDQGRDGDGTLHGTDLSSLVTTTGAECSPCPRRARADSTIAGGRPADNHLS